MAVKIAEPPAEIVAVAGAAVTVKSGDAVAPDRDWSAGIKSSRPWSMPGPLSGAACATAAAASDSVIAVFKLRASAAAPETKGALNEVPHPAA